jgi:hypothetical protein
MAWEADQPRGGEVVEVHRQRGGGGGGGEVELRRRRTGRGGSPVRRGEGRDVRLARVRSCVRSRRRLDASREE